VRDWTPYWALCGSTVGLPLAHRARGYRALSDSDLRHPIGRPRRFT